MDQDATWYGGRPRLRRHCVRWRPSSPPKGHTPQFSAHVYCGQTAVYAELGLSLCDIVLDEDPVPPPLKGHSPPFWPMSVVAKWLDGLRCHLVWR